MHIFSAQETAAALPFPAMLKQMEAIFATGATAPQRHHHTIPQASGGQDVVLLLMPAWEGSEHYMGVKIANVHPDNSQRGLPAVMASYLLIDKLNGEHLALFDGSVLTARRTAAASVLGAKYLANPQARTLLVVGSGRVARVLPEAFSSQFPIERVLIWNHRTESAETLVRDLRQQQNWNSVTLCEDLATGVAEADIISCATLAREPLIAGQWLKGGQHVDLLGSFTPVMREADDETMRRAHVYIDTPAALQESGELIMPIESGALQATDICGDLYYLCQQASSQYDPARLTVFKGVGHALEDLACAMTAWENYTKN